MRHFIIRLALAFHGRIPDRLDFGHMGHEEPVPCWEQCVMTGKALAEDFAELIEGGEPLSNATAFD